MEQRDSEGDVVVVSVPVAAVDETLSGAVAARDRILAFRLVGWALPDKEKGYYNFDIWK